MHFVSRKWAWPFRLLYLKNELTKWADFFHTDANLRKLRVLGKIWFLFFFFSFFLFCLRLTLISTAKGDFVSNVLYQRYQYSAILLTVPGVWDRPCCLQKTILVVTEINLSTTNKLKINKKINEIWAKMLSTNQITGFLNQLYL